MRPINVGDLHNKEHPVHRHMIRLDDKGESSLEMVRRHTHHELLGDSLNYKEPLCLLAGDWARCRINPEQASFEIRLKRVEKGSVP